VEKRCDRNRKRSQRRAIFCPIHHCYIHSTSQKYSLFADQAEHLQQRGFERRYALMAVAQQTTVALTGEWLEEFWCDHCQSKTWYHVHKCDRVYNLSVARPQLWQQATGVIDPHGNPSVSEFSRHQARMADHKGIKDFSFVS
jgi:hypothetical protein